MPEGVSTILMSFSGVYGEEGFLPEDAVVVDLDSLGGTECYCSDEAAKAIRESISGLPAGALHWIDSGDYHYVTKFWLEKVDEPFSLVLLDNHPDDQAPALGEGILSCGSWVSDAKRELANLKETLWVKEALPEAGLPDLPVYLSIDKDILCRCCARTNWDQGSMMTADLTSIIRSISERRRIIGIDVCGEVSLSKGASGFDLQINRQFNEELQVFLVNLPNKL